LIFMLIRFRFAVLGLVLATSGCIATDLSQLNTRYDVLAQRKTSLPPAPQSPTSTTYYKNVDDVEAGFSSVASDAYSLSKGTGIDPATKIVTLRLATVAAWQANDNAKDPKSVYSNARADGQNACDQLGKGASGAPRDCAIITYVPVLRAYEDLAQKMIALRTPTASDISTIASGLSTLLQAQLLSLPKILAGDAPYAGISPTTTDYFRKVAFASACLAEHVVRTGENQLPTGPDKDQALQSARKTAGDYAQLLAAAGLLSVNDRGWYSQPGACPPSMPTVP
jgi:hypothetical protein